MGVGMCMRPVARRMVVLMAMVIIGGAGTLTGPIIGAIALLSLPAALSFLSFIPSTEIGTVQQFIYGALMTLLIAVPTGVKFFTVS